MLQPGVSSASNPVVQPAAPQPRLVQVAAAAAPAFDAIDRLDDGYYEIDMEFRYRRVNPAGLRIAGKTRDDMIGQHVFAVFPDIVQDPVHEAARRVMERRLAETVETFYAPHHRWYVNSIYPVEGGIAIFSRDITEQKLLAQNLAFLAEASKILSSSLDYRQTLSSVAQLAVPRIADWCAVDMLTAPHTVELLAVAHVDPEKMRWAEELRQQDPVDLDRPVGLAKVLRSGQPEFYPEISDELLAATAKDERTLQIARGLGFSSAMIVPLVVRDATIGAVTFVTAESGRHYAPADLHMAQELASRAALAIENSRLYGESQQAVALRDDFISVASHELKTPVTSLRVYAEVLQRQAAQRHDEQTSHSLGKMVTQLGRLTLLVSDLLDVSRIDAGKLELRRDSVDLRQLVGEVVDALRATTSKHRIDVVGTIRQPLTGDRERLEQVLTNLLTNAIKYSPQGERVIVRLAETAHDATIEVEDFGIGIDPDDRGRIFDRFYRSSSSQQRTFPGLGMGLYISSEIVRRHGGTIWATSDTGRGSVFHVVLPFAAEADRAR